VEVAHATTAQHRLDILIGHPATALLGDDPGDWRALAATRAIVGRIDLASAALFALDSGVDVLTQDPGWYADLGGARITLEIED
jgi:hypothetical protein